MKKGEADFPLFFARQRRLAYWVVARQRRLAYWWMGELS